jgi:hypothetical protein
LLYFLLGLLFGVVIAVIVDELLIRILIVVAAAAGIWLLSKDAGIKPPIPGDTSAAATAIRQSDLRLENVAVSQTGYGWAGYALSGTVTNDSNSSLAMIYFQITLTDCRDSDCRIVGQENTSASVAVPPKQMRAFISLAVRFDDLPAPGSATRSWSYRIMGLKAGTDTDRPQQAKAANGGNWSAVRSWPG